MSTTIGNLHKENYTIHKQPVTVVADFENNTVKVMSQAYSKTFKMDEYTEFEGNMKNFAEKKIHG